jgi:hypothetical protein
MVTATTTIERGMVILYPKIKEVLERPEPISLGIRNMKDYNSIFVFLLVP